MDNEKIHKTFIDACIYDNLDVVKFLLFSKRIKYNADITYNHYEGFIQACSNGSEKVVKFLLTSPRLVSNPSLSISRGLPLMSICANGHTKLFEYVISNPELLKGVEPHYQDDIFIKTFSNKHKAIYTTLLTSQLFDVNMHAEHCRSLISACSNNYIDGVKFLLSSPEIKKNMYPLVEGNGAFREAAFADRLEIIEYLYTFPVVKEYIAKNPNACGLVESCDARFRKTTNVFHFLINIPEIRNNIEHILEEVGESCFRNACSNNAFDIIQYFMIDLHYKVSDSIITWLSGANTHKIVFTESIRLIENLQLKQTLQDELPVTTNSKKKMKV